MTLIEAVATRLEEIMKEKDVTQYRLFILSGVPQSTISYIRRKRSETVNLSVIYELMDGLELDLNYFFDSPLFKRGNLE